MAPVQFAFSCASALLLALTGLPSAYGEELNAVVELRLRPNDTSTSNSSAAFDYIPEAIRPPADNKVFLELYAFGTQNYRCQKNGTNSSWINTANAQLFKPPSNDSAQLIAVNQKRPVALHFFSTFADKDAPIPTWKYGIGDRGSECGEVTAKRDVATPDPVNPKANIAWVRLKPADVAPLTGKFGPTTYVLRVKTAGGVAPAIDQCSEPGKITRVPYEATYLFYKNK